MIKKYCSCVRAVQNNGKNSKEIDDFVREITGGKYYARMVRITGSVWIVNASNNVDVEHCYAGWYIVEGNDGKYKILSSDIFENIFEEIK